MRRLMSVRAMLTLMCLSCLIGLLLVTVISMQLIFPRYYRSQTIRNLKEAYYTICEKGVSDAEEANLQVMARLERNNLSILVFVPETGKVVYNSRIDARRLDQIVAWQSDALQAALSETDDSYIVEVLEPNEITTAGVPVEYGGTFYLGGRSAPYLVVVTTPMESVDEVAASCIRFMAVVSVIVMIATMIIISMTSRKVTRPLTEMTRVARKIADLDFSQVCIEAGSREQRVMARSLNSMSERMQNYILQLQTDLEEKTRLEEARKNLVANLSHDLKTPIGLVGGYAEGLAAGMARTPEQMQEYCEIILDETERMNIMIARMLELSRLESGTVKLEPVELELSEMLEGILSHFALMVQKESIELTTNWDPNLWVRADEYAVEQVLTNLIQNALTHLDGERRVCVNACRRDAAIRIEVFNTTDPIPQDILEHLWDIFYRRERARTRRGNEAGLGLAVVRTNLELMNVPYGAENVAGGILFWLELPAL